jgi:mono/diheme cytochrome c family protein
MLHGADRTLELLGWALAVLFVVMMFVGPQVIAEDKPAEQSSEAAGAAPYAGQSAGGEGSEAADGKAVFTETCGGCHTLSAAGTSGTSGPNLDGVSLDAGAIEAIVREGRGGMPAFGGDLSDDEIAAVAAFVAGAR